jgi:hypothetical protein
MYKAFQSVEIQSDNYELTSNRTTKYRENIKSCSIQMYKNFCYKHMMLLRIGRVEMASTDNLICQHAREVTTALLVSNMSD